MVPLWLTWQLVDSAFPTGAFAHSSSLEAAWQHGLVKNPADVADFVRSGLRQCRHGVVPFARATWKASENDLQADRDCDLFLNNHVANRASRAQGRAFLTTAARIFPNESLAKRATQMHQSRAFIHLSPIFGMVCACLELSETQTVELFLFIFARGCLSSAVRLGIIGPMEAQRIQYHLAQEHDSLFKLSDGPPVQTAPVLDLLQGTQDRLYSKLFQS